MSLTNKLKRKYYPDKSYDGTLAFYNWIGSCLSFDFKVLNVGAGTTSERKEKSLRGKVEKVVGIDVDPEVLKNSDLDEAYIIDGKNLPFPDNYFDLAWADYVFEHLKDPEYLLREVFRVLRPGGSFFFRTPNMYHYVTLFSRNTPHWLHALLADRMRGLAARPHKMTYPTFYRINSLSKIKTIAHKVGFNLVEIQPVEKEPSYFMFNCLLFFFGMIYERVVNRFEGLSGIRANLFGRLVK
ncbi:MAG: class I SAM-dependent methyltransferase [Candidatus Saganbacteria bacterium]|nr:class I SAM-dependent methyltransferase [Candidatus Saganbacteria bacterium]